MPEEHAKSSSNLSRDVSLDSTSVVYTNPNASFTSKTSFRQLYSMEIKTKTGRAIGWLSRGVARLLPLDRLRQTPVSQCRYRDWMDGWMETNNGLKKAETSTHSARRRRLCEPNFQVDQSQGYLWSGCRCSSQLKQKKRWLSRAEWGNLPTDYYIQ